MLQFSVSHPRQTDLAAGNQGELFEVKWFGRERGNRMSANNTEIVKQQKHWIMMQR